MDFPLQTNPFGGTPMAMETPHSIHRNDSSAFIQVTCCFVLVEDLESRLDIGSA